MADWEEQAAKERRKFEARQSRKRAHKEIDKPEKNQTLDKFKINERR